METFLSKFAAVVRGVVSGFDRIFFRGTLRNLAYPAGLQHYLWANRIPFKDFDRHSQEVTERLQEASLRQAQQEGREIRYVNSSELSKEDLAREIAARDRIRSGLICVLRSVDPCMSFQINKNRLTRKLEIRYRPRKCLHLYHYQIHPVFGFMHARIQTWFPFGVHVCLNGREWLARQMDQAKLKYLRRKNTFTWLEDVAQAQALLHQQLQADWPSLLNDLAATLDPLHQEIFAKYRTEYYWSADQSEWATDVMFRSRADLQAIFPQLIRYAITTFGAADVLRFLGRRLPASGKVPHWRRWEVVTNLKERLEGIRIKHWVNDNSAKLYDKDSVLRAECTVQNPEDFKVYRSVEGDPDGPKQWRPLRWGVVDMPLRAEVSQGVNDRYLQALAAVHLTTPLRQIVDPLCRPALEPIRQRENGLGENVASAGACPVAAPQDELPASGCRSTEVHAVEQTQVLEPTVATASCGGRASKPRRVRALNPLAEEDAALLEAVARHEFLINGLRNRDLRPFLYEGKAADRAEHRRRCAAVTRKLRLLRAHGLIRKVLRTHRYIVSEEGRKAITALLAARNASTEALISDAA
jgi:hypothetical protein